MYVAKGSSISQIFGREGYRRVAAKSLHLSYIVSDSLQANTSYF